MESLNKMFLNFRKISLLPAFLFLLSCEPAEPENKVREQSSEAAVTPAIPYSVTGKVPHDPTAFTEGLFFNNGVLFESTGSPSNLPETYSCYGIVDTSTGKIDRKAELDKAQNFGEGILMMNNYIYQLTYTNQVCFIYDAKTFERKGQFNYTNREGWGMTTDGEYMIISDGTEILTFLDPKSYTVAKELSVTENGFAVFYLNELEFINGYIYANIWMTNEIVKIDPVTGKITGRMNFDDLYRQAKAVNPRSLEMNGIAYDPESGVILVTGKLWPYYYKISFRY